MSTSNPTPKSLYDLIAKTGDNITSLGTLTGFEDSPSINESGLIAFIGRSNNKTDLLVENGLEYIINLSGTPSYSMSFSKGVQINNQNQVVARETLGSLSAIRRWAFSGSDGVFATGKFPVEFVNFENVFPFPSLNNNGQAVFLATPEGQFPNISLVTLRGTGLFGNRTYNEGILATQNARPMIADNGKVVVRDPVSAIVLNDYELNPREIIAGNSFGFTYVGLSPGISDDGKIVTFYGELNDAGAKTLGLTPGNGIFASIETDSGTRRITRIAGIAGNGYLDPGESHEDVNKNGKVDPGEDKGVITSFAKDERVGVNYRSVGDNNFGTVAYLAFNEGQESLFSSQFKISSSDSKITPLHPHTVAKVGVEAKLVSPALTGVIQDLNIYDPVNDKGQVAFWLRTSTSQEAIVRANPILKPVLIVPGIGGALPPELNPATNRSGYATWLLNRGVDPETLEIEPNRHTFDDLIETLKQAGYVEGVNLFTANYDWRLNPGPVEASIDGKINRSAAELTDDTYEYAVDQLGFWLEKAVKGWRSQFPGMPESEIPELDSVDIIAHSTGGLVARTYIQSDAYGESFSFKNESGSIIETNLPKVNHFFMLGVPNRGSSLPWNPLNNNFIAGPGIQIIGAMIKAAFEKVSKGQKILLSGKDNIEGVITPPPAGTKLDPLEFIEQYVPTFRSLLATYPFIDVASDNPSDALRTIESIDPSPRNTFLLDLNNGFDSVAGGGDPNLFADLVEQVTVIYGTSEDTRDAVTKKDEPDFKTIIDPSFAVPIDIPLDTVRKFGDWPSVPKGIWYRDEKGLVVKNSETPTLQGDDAVPLLSAEGTFLGDTRDNIDRQPFTKGENTNDTVDHTGIVSNIDVQKLILETLGVNLDEELISTSLETRYPRAILNLGSSAFSEGSSVIFDPVEGFLVDGSGRRLGYSSATGSVTEIPNSFWLGDEDGIGWFEGSVEGPFQLQLTGLGEEYFISISLVTEDGPGGIEVEGFLAEGEQKTFDIPINNSPVLDLNGSTQGIDFSTTFGASGTTVAIVDPSLVLADLDSANLQGATITLTNPQDNASEFLNATPVGNIAVTYNPTTSTLTLSGSDPIANYQQVLRTVTYTNTATTPNRLDREITFVVDDGVGFNNLSPVATTTLTLVDSTLGEIIEGTRGRDILTGTDGDDVITGFRKRDTLTGNGGNDQFVYNSLADRRDLITDFEVGSDKIVLTNLLDSMGYSGSNPLADGIVQMISRQGSSLVRIDPDGLGTARTRPLLLVENVAVDDLNNVNNFVF